MDNDLNININNGNLKNGNFIQDNSSKFLSSYYSNNEIIGKHSMTIKDLNETFSTRYKIEIKGDELFYFESEGHRDARFKKE